MTATARLQPNGDRVMSRKDYTVLCQAGDNAVKCPLPKAQAFDSIDKQVPISSSIFLVDQDGKTMNKKVAKVDRSKCCILWVRTHVIPDIFIVVVLFA